METITRNVNEIDSADRQALEHVLGVPLRDNQQVVINVVTPNASGTQTQTTGETLPEWCNVYAGLSSEEIDRLDKATRQRLDLSRAST